MRECVMRYNIDLLTDSESRPFIACKFDRSEEVMCAFCKAVTRINSLRIVWDSSVYKGIVEIIKLRVDIVVHVMWMCTVRSKIQISDRKTKADELFILRAYRSRFIIHVHCVRSTTVCNWMGETTVIFAIYYRCSLFVKSTKTISSSNTTSGF